jgi:hypothetical protein
LTGIAEVTSRIQQIQSHLDQMAIRFGAGVGGGSFASALTAAQRTDGSQSVGGQGIGGQGIGGQGIGGAALDLLGSLNPLGGPDTVDRVSGALSPSGPTGADVVADAKKYLGVPYVFGGNDPATGLDCSSLVQRVFKDLGVSVPRLVRDQLSVGQPVASLGQAKPGDLLVFDGHEHIGIYLGGNKMLHAPQPGERVKITSVYETPTAIRRVVPAEQIQASAVTASNALLRASVLGLSSSTVGALTGGGSGGSSGGLLEGVPFGNLFTSAGARRGISPALLAAVAKVESNYDPDAVSPAGARGLMQITPPTAHELGVDPLVPNQAVDGAARLLRRNLNEFGSVPLALAAYNAGGGSVRRYGGIPPFAETQAYVAKVQNALRALGKDA